MKPICLAFLLIAVAVLQPSPLIAEEKFDASALYEKCVESTVFIVTPLKDGTAMGSGSLIDAEQRFVITNFHIINGSDTVHVQFPVRNRDGSLTTDKKKYIKRIEDGQAIKGKVLHVDKTRDLALVHLEKVPVGAPALPLARKSIKVGEPVIKIMNPSMMDATFATVDGEVRGVAVVDHVVGSGDGALRIKAKMVQTTHPIGAHDSGGPVIDRRGYQVGVSSSGRSGVQAVNNAIDVTEVHAFLKEKKVTLRLPPEPIPPPMPIPPPPERTNEQIAADMLKRAKLFAEDADSRTIYVSRLKNLVSKYPNSAASKEAKKLLDDLKK